MVVVLEGVVHPRAKGSSQAVSVIVRDSPG